MRLYVLACGLIPTTVPKCVFQSSTLIGWVRVGSGCCQGNGTNVHIVMYNIMTNRIRALKAPLFPGTSQFTCWQS